MSAHPSVKPQNAAGPNLTHCNYETCAKCLQHGLTISSLIIKLQPIKDIFQSFLLPGKDVFQGCLQRKQVVFVFNFLFLQKASANVQRAESLMCTVWMSVGRDCWGGKERAWLPLDLSLALN